MEIPAHTKWVIHNFLQSSKEKWFYTACFPFLILLYGSAKYFHIPIYDIVADPAELCQREPYLGFLSQAGLLVWVGGITSCFLTLSLLKSQKQLSRKWRFFLLYSGLFSVFLCMDDWLQLHESLPAAILNTKDASKPLQNVLEFGFYGLYLAFLIFYAYKFKSLIYQTRYLFLVAAVLFFVLSNVVDLFTSESLSFHFALEEGLKFLGIVSWSSYLWYGCKDILALKI